MTNKQHSEKNELFCIVHVETKQLWKHGVKVGWAKPGSAKNSWANYAHASNWRSEVEVVPRFDDQTEYVIIKVDVEKLLTA